MSSISALWSLSGAFDTTARHRAMLSAQACHGRNGSGSWSSPQLSLGRNLSHLLPEDLHDRQPMWTADGSACMVADVRLDNRADLIRELHLTQAELLSDAHVLLSAWERWSETCLEHLTGAFAFAVWQPHLRELFAARDHRGERPLHYHRGRDLFALASMPKGLTVLPGVGERILDRGLLIAMQLEPADRTASHFEGIDRLPPGHWLKVSPSSFESRCYWQPSDAKPVRYRRDADYAEALFELLDRATAAQLRTTGSVGSHLSAGLDSSSVAACAAAHLGLEGRRLTAFTAVPRSDYSGHALPGKMISEAPAAAEVVQFYSNIDHVLSSSEGRDLFADMRDATAARDQPLRNGVNQTWIMGILQQAVNPGITAMLHGQQGNAAFSYDGIMALRDLFDERRLFKLAKTALALRRSHDTSLKYPIHTALGGVLPTWSKRLLYPKVWSYEPFLVLIQPDHPLLPPLRQRLAERPFEDHYDRLTDRRLLLEGVDMGNVNAGDLAQSGVEPRDPTADRRVFEFSYAVPVEQFLVGGRTRSLARRALRGRLPATTLERRLRGQQGVDWHLKVGAALPAFRAELEQMRLSPTACRLLNLDHLQHLIDTWPAQNDGRATTIMTWNVNLCRAIAAGHFLRMHDLQVRSKAAQFVA